VSSSEQVVVGLAEIELVDGFAVFIENQGSLLVDRSLLFEWHHKYRAFDLTTKESRKRTLLKRTTTAIEASSFEGWLKEEEFLPGVAHGKAKKSELALRTLDSKLHWPILMSP